MEHVAVNGLAYVVIDTSDVDAWERFATDVIGMKVTRRGGDLWLRIDDRAQRMVVRPATNDALAAIGWDVAHSDLDVVRAVLASSGHEVANATPDELESRGVA